MPAPPWLLSAGGVNASLDIDFANDRAYAGGPASTPAALLTCTRASTGYAETVAGTLTSFATNTLRRTDKGVLVEGARTNLVLRSQEFDNAYWLKAGATVTSDSTAAPDGQSTAESATEDTSNGYHRVYKDNSLSLTAVPHTLSVYVKSNGTTWLQLLSYDGTTIFWRNYNISAGAIGNGANTSNTAITALANGWFRCAFTFTPVVYANGHFQILLSNSNTASQLPSYTGDGSSGVYIWGAQLEAASFASSYIPTTSSSATRAADVVSFTWTRDPSLPITLYTDFASVDAAASGNQFILSLNGGSVSNRISAFKANLGETIGQRVTSGGSASVSTAAGTINAGGKFAVAVQAGDYQSYFAGSAVSASAGAVMPVSLTQLQFGSELGSELFNYIRRAAYFPVRVSNTDLQALTT